MIDTDRYTEDIDETYNLIMNIMDDVEREFEIKTRIRLSNKMKAAIDKLDTEVKRLRKLEAAVVGSWVEACEHGAPWHKELRGPCVELGYFELRDVEHTRKSFDGKAFTYTNKEYCLKEEYQEMAKEWMVEIYGED